MDYIDRKHLLTTSIYLDGFKDLGNDRFNCRCPLCGDSDKNKRKKRGYFFVHDNTTFYKCHNCGASLNLLGFLNAYSPDLASQYKFDKFASKYKKKEIVQDIKLENFIDKTTVLLKKTHDLLDKCQRILSLNEEHPARLYLDGRRIPSKHQKTLFYVQNANKFIKNIEGYEKTWAPPTDAILIPFYNEVGVLTYCQLRFLEGKMRYLTLEISKGKKIWGLFDIDWEKPVYIVEGPFDAMFVDNCLAVAGVSILSECKYFGEKCKAGYTLIFDKDYQINRAVYDQMVKAIEDGEKVVMFDKYFLGKDVNDAVMKGEWSSEELMQYLKEHTKSGLIAKLALDDFKKPLRNFNNEKKSPAWKKQS